MTKEEIIKAASITYGNAMRRALWGKTLACYMFTEGMKYQKTGEMPVDDLDKIMEGIGDALELKKSLDEETVFDFNKFNLLDHRHESYGRTDP